jgi:alcohol dehydrogenase
MSAPDPIPLPGVLRIHTILAGICNTDLEMVQGYASFQGILGHEFIGLVDQAEDQALVGQRVVGEIHVACDNCQKCRDGHASHCPNRTALAIRGQDGALAEYFCPPENNLHTVPQRVADEVAVFAEPLAAACEILDQVHVRPTERVVVLGDGKLGLLIA